MTQVRPGKEPVERQSDFDCTTILQVEASHKEAVASATGRFFRPPGENVFRDSPSTDRACDNVSTI